MLSMLVIPTLFIAFAFAPGAAAVECTESFDKDLPAYLLGTPKAPAPKPSTSSAAVCADCQASPPPVGNGESRLRVVGQQIQRLAPSPSPSAPPLSAEFSAARACVSGAIQSGAVARSQYGSCAKGSQSGRPRTLGQPPCATDKMTGALAQALLLSGQCLGVNWREIFPMMAHESRFQLNVSSTTGAGGVGQLTGPGIADVNRAYFSDGATRLSASSFPQLKNAACQPLREMSRLDGSISNSCERISLPDNPLRSIAYGTLLFSLYKGESEGYYALAQLKSWAKYQPHRYSDADLKRLAPVLTYYMYNGGPSVAPVILARVTGIKVTPQNARKLFAEAAKKPRVVKTSSSYPTGPTAAVARAAQRTVRSETAKYVDKIVNETFALPEGAGLRCATNELLSPGESAR